MAKSKDIEYLEPGWRWIAAGKEEWVTSTGEKSTARHARKGNETLSTRQVQNIQRSEKSRLGAPKAPTIPRSGKIRTIKGERVKGGRGGKGSSLYRHSERGRVENLVFRSFQDARNYVILNGLPEWSEWGMLQIRYTERLRTTSNVGSDEINKNGYASLTGFVGISHDPRKPDLVSMAVEGQESRGAIPNPWIAAEQRLKNYDMSGSKARVYIYLAEKGE